MNPSAPLLLALLAVAAPPQAFFGQIREVSGGPGGRSQAILLADGGRRLTLHALRPAEATELIRLSGVRVQLRTTTDAQLPGPHHVRVLSYQILDVGGGIKPRVGHIARLEQAGSRRLVFVDETGRADWLPAGWTKKLDRHVGSKVWMAGRRKGGVFSPSRFAILRPAKTRAKQPAKKRKVGTP